jgi:hypothetical protein
MGASGRVARNSREALAGGNEFKMNGLRGRRRGETAMMNAVERGSRRRTRRSLTTEWVRRGAISAII